jgi:hypothetical protein
MEYDWENGSEGMGGGGGQGGRRDEKVNDTGSEDERVRGELTAGKMRGSGTGPVQPKPAREGIGKTTVEMSADLSEARNQASEALRQQKVGPAQRDLVSDFYKNLTPERK